jgi:hypothetical protein
VEPALDLAAGPFDFGMPGMADQHHVVIAAGVTAALVVNFVNQWAGRIDDIELTAFGISLDFTRHAMRAEDGHGAERDLVDLVDEDRAPRLQVIDDVMVVNDFMAHIDRGAKSLERPLDDLNGALDAGAEAARLR